MANLDIKTPLTTVTFPFRLAIYVLIILLMANLNALIDHFQHLEIPYFDEEHIIVGSIAGGVCLAMTILLEILLRHLNSAIGEIKVLESFLSICTNCKKVRAPGADPDQKDSWQPIDSYISRMTTTRFSHGLCPDCVDKLYPELQDDKKQTA